MFGGLPNPSAWKSQVLNALREHFRPVTSVFVHYCKFGPECATLDSACQLRPGGLKRLVKDAALEVSGFELDSMLRLFVACSRDASEPSSPARDGRASGESMRLHQFVGLLVQLASERESAAGSIRI